MSRVVRIVCYVGVLALTPPIELAAQTSAVVRSSDVALAHGSRLGPGAPDTPQRRAGGNYRVLYAFKGGYAGGPDGALPSSGLTAVNGTLYGTTSIGGVNFGGTVFKISTSGAESVLHAFGGPGVDGFPEAALIDVNDVLYGTTSEGGSFNSGTVFALAITGQERVVHSFGKRGDGRYPYGGPLVYANGVLYGVTTNGGIHDDGALFEVSMRGAERVLHSFGASRADGSFPNGGLLDLSGTVYGTTAFGGAYGQGTVYEFSKAGERILYNFKGAPDAGDPNESPIIVSNVLYGTSRYGGAYDDGTVYAFNGSAERVLYSFKSIPDGANPQAGLIVVKGAGYGTTENGGAYGYGTIFRITASGIETVLHSFKGGTDGAAPTSGLIFVDGAFYGTTYYGGNGGTCGAGGYAGCGTVFKLTL